MWVWRRDARRSAISSPCCLDVSVPVVLREYRTDMSTYYELIRESYVHAVLDAVIVEFELR